MGLLGMLCGGVEILVCKGACRAGLAEVLLCCVAVLLIPMLNSLTGSKIRMTGTAFEMGSVLVGMQGLVIGGGGTGVERTGTVIGMTILVIGAAG